MSEAKATGGAGAPGAAEEAAGAGGATDELMQLRREVAALRAEVADLRRRRRFAELEVERVNVVEPDGRLRLVLSGEARAPDPVMDGETGKRGGGNKAGLIFYNEEGDECGGLIFHGKREDGRHAAGAYLLFDQFKQDQTIGLGYSAADDRHGAWLQVWERPDRPMRAFTERVVAARQLPPGPERAAAFAQLRAEGVFGADRIFVGKMPDKEALIQLHDSQGRVRLRLAVGPTGAPRIEFLDEAGRVVVRLPDAAPADSPHPEPPRGGVAGERCTGYECPLACGGRRVPRRHQRSPWPGDG